VELKKRKCIEKQVVKFYKVTKGTNFSEERTKLATDISSAMLADGSWKDQKFKEYNYKALGKPIRTGNLHPLMKVRQQFRLILMGLGFQEMPTNKYVESSFWNFDTLFQP